MTAHLVTGCVMQPTFMPWLGLFDLIDQCEVIVLLDDVGFSKQSWQQRNRLRNQQGLTYLTVPVRTSGRLGQPIYAVELADATHPSRALHKIERLYHRSAAFDEHFPRLTNAYLGGASTGYLAQLNIALIQELCASLNLRRWFVRSSEIESEGSRGTKVADLCRRMNIDLYLSPKGAADYLSVDRSAFDDRGVDIVLQNYVHPTYRQQYEPFVSHASCLDLIFNEGSQSLDIIRSGRRSNVPLSAWKGEGDAGH